MGPGSYLQAQKKWKTSVFFVMYLCFDMHIYVFLFTTHIHIYLFVHVVYLEEAGRDRI